MNETPSHCHDCGAAVTYHYCAVCGQETRLHVPSAGEFLHEFIGHYVAFEGKLWKTLWLLLCKPGRLTADYLAGRRARYVAPLRLYLTFSLLFFAMLKFSGAELFQSDPEPEKPAAASAQAAPKPAVVVFGKENTKWTSKLDAFEAMDNADKRRVVKDAFFGYGPYALFCLLPLFAAWLKLLYPGSGRRYGEHLLFALHSNAVAYIMLALLVLLPWEPLKALAVFWLLAYLPIAMQRVYGGRRWLTGLRWLLLSLLHLLSMGVVIALAFLLAVTR